MSFKVDHLFKKKFKCPGCFYSSINERMKGEAKRNIPLCVGVKFLGKVNALKDDPR